MSIRPLFQLTVPESLWQAAVEEVGNVLADAWLYGASLRDDVLLFRTQSGHDSAKSDARFVAMAAALKIKIVRPGEPWPKNGNSWSARDAR